MDERGGGSLRLAAPWEGGRGERIGGGVERPIKEWMKGERDLCAWLRHGREGEERCVYKRMVFGCLVTERTCYHHHVHHPVHRLRRLS